MNFAEAQTCTSDSFAKINVWNNSEINIDNSAYAVKNSNSDFVALFKNNGYLYLKGVCVNNPVCNPPSNSFLIKNSIGEVVSYIDSSGNLCIESGDCSSISASCNPTTGAFLVKNPAGTVVSYIDSAGDLCLTGSLNSERSIGKQYLLNLLQQATHNSKIVKFESLVNDNSIIISVDGTMSNSLAKGAMQLIGGLNIRNFEASCVTVTTTTTSTTTTSSSLGIGETTTSSTTTSTTASSGGPGPGDGGTTSNTKTWSRVRANELKEYFPSVVKVTRISFKLNEETRDVRLKVKKLSPSSAMTKPDGEVYQYFEIDFNVERSKFAMSKIEFEVEKEWINRKGLTKNNIKLMKYSGGSWISLATNIFSETNTRINYEVPDAKGFSDFAIVGKASTSATTIPIINGCGNGIIDSNEDCSNCPSDVRCRSDEYCNYGVCTKRQAPPPPENTCGNGVRNVGEDCRSCPSDVRCGSGEYCSAGICVEEEELETRFNIMDYIWILVIGILILVGLIVAAVIYIRASKKTSEYKLKNTDNKKSDRLKSMIEEQVAQGYTKEQIRISALRAGWPKDIIEEVLRNVK